MESWSYVSGGKGGFMSDESVSASVGGIASGENGLGGWEMKAPCSYGSTLVCSSQQGIDCQKFVELDSSDVSRKPLLHDSIRNPFGSKIHFGKVLSPVTTPANAFSTEETSCKLSGSVVESNCRDSSLIDLQLGRFGDHSEGNNFKTSKATLNLSSAESSVPAKRVRAGGLNSQVPYCQVHGCKKDLSSSKDYHKRHKVCEVHSKTAKVIVNGIEQRFCQQCSRFHLLGEFDDGKRSCRKRLAGHNERRRKPHLGIQSGRGRLFQSYNGNRFQGSAFASSSFVCPDILPSGLLHSHKYDLSDWYRHVKVEVGSSYSPQLAIPFSNGHLQSKSLLNSYNSGKESLPLHDNEVNAGRNKISENNNMYLHNMAGPDFVSHSLFQSTSIGTEVLTGLDSSSPVQGLSGISNSGRALSLLSSQSQNSTNHSSGFPTGQSLVTPGSHVHYSATRGSEKLLGVSSQASTSGLSSAYHSSAMNSSEETRLDQMLMSDNSDDGVNYGINGVIQGSVILNAKNNLICEDGSTINLLQLSSQLQRVQHQRHSMQVKQEDDTFGGLRIS